MTSDMLDLSVLPSALRLSDPAINDPPAPDTSLLEMSFHVINP
jgi:hypothetical protein